MKLLAILFAVLSPLAVHAEVRVSISGGEKVGDPGAFFSSDGILRVINAHVKIPFDEEYRISLDNRDSSRRALVHVQIDGRPATGDGLILRKGESVQLERFIDNGDLKRGPKFKFVDIDEQKRLSRSTSKEDGLIAVTVQYERDNEPLVKYSDSTGYASTITIPNNLWGGHINTNSTMNASAVLEPGITIEGSESKQRFQKAELGDMGDRIETLTIRLLGYYKGTPLLMRSR